MVMWYWTEVFIWDPRVPALLSFPALLHFKAIFLYYFFFLLANTHSPSLPPSLPPTSFFIVSQCPPFSISLSFPFPSIALPPSSRSSLSPYLLSSINASTSLSIPFPHLFIYPIHFVLPSPGSLNPSPTHLLSLFIPLSVLYASSSIFKPSSSSSSSSPQSYQGKGISKSVSMNCGPCQGMPQGLSHSDSYTWAMENRRPSTAQSANKDGSICSLGSQDLSYPDIYPDNCIPTESQVCVISIVNVRSVRRSLVMGSNLILKSLRLYFMYRPNVFSFFFSVVKCNSPPFKMSHFTFESITLHYKTSGGFSWSCQACFCFTHDIFFFFF